MKIAWELKDIQYNTPCDLPQTEINKQWVPARPLNYQKKYTPIWTRLYRSWLVFNGKLDCFYWPQGQ
jgi:hypothetical protein